MNTRPHTIAELLHHWPVVCRKATNEWAKDFAFSIWKQSGRRGWKPTLKQERLMRKMVRELFACGEEDDPQLIEMEG